MAHNHVELSRDAINWINGELLGDGCIPKSKSIHAAWFQYGSKYLEYIQYITRTLSSFGIAQSGGINNYSYKKYSGSSYHYKSLSYAELLSIRNRWYPKGEKIVPRDIKLTPTTCRQWYIGDGSLQHKWHQMSWIVLCTDAFPISDVEWLIEQLADIGILATRFPSSNRIRISGYSTIDFLSYIGECPVECYLYKWNYYNISE